MPGLSRDRQHSDLDAGAAPTPGSAGLPWELGTIGVMARHDVRACRPFYPASRWRSTS